MTFDQVGTLSLELNSENGQKLFDQTATIRKVGYNDSKTSASSTTRSATVGWKTETLSQIFETMVADWVRETRFTNSMTEILDNKNLANIIDLGPSVVPLILKDLDVSPKPWFYALRILTGEDPVTEENAGNLGLTGLQQRDFRINDANVDRF
jgi:hypothetical protein